MKISHTQNKLCSFLATWLLCANLSSQQPEHSRVESARGLRSVWTSHPLYFGVDYYPEDYSLEQVEQDAASMEHASLNVVRLLDSNWAKIETTDGHFDFDWLDHVLGILDKHRIKVLLGVPSYSPPYWLIQSNPEMMLIDREGRRYRPGGLGYVNIFDPVYLRYVHRLDRALAEHYGHDPRIIGWQIDNERGIFGAACYNRTCLDGFHTYLTKKYGTVAELNQRWGTVSYGHQFSSFEEVPLDWLPVGDENHQSSLEFAAKQFFAEAQGDFIRDQADIFRRLTANQFLTHNAAFPNLRCDYLRLSQPLDFIGFDNYPELGNSRQVSFNLDLARGYNHGSAYMILEEAAGAPGPTIYTDGGPPPGQLRLWAYQAVAHGADGILFFRWRTARSGSEEFWQGLLDPAGQDTRRLREIAGMGNELKKLAPHILGTSPSSEIALLYSWDSWAAMSVGSAKPPYMDHLIRWHAALVKSGLGVSVISPSDDFSAYRIVIAPDLYLVDTEIAKKLEGFVQNGGTLVLGPRAATKGAENRFYVDEPAPGPLRRLAGITISESTLIPGAKANSTSDEYVPASENNVIGKSSDWPGNYRATEWADVLELQSAESLFAYSRDYIQGRPAVTLNALGRGQVYYFGSIFDEEFYVIFAKRVAKNLALSTLASIPPGVEAVERQNGTHRLLFLLNFASEQRTAQVAGRWEDLLTGRDISGNLTIESFGVQVLVQAKNALWLPKTPSN